MYDLIIIGGGPAGLTATVYAIHKRLETLLITEDLGGKANYRMHIRGLESYETINGEELVRKFQNQVEQLDFARLMDKVLAVEALQTNDGREIFWVTTESGTSFMARALLVATGARPRMLDVPGEHRLLGLGVSYSAISHAPLFWGKDTAVVGSDVLAFRSVAELATLANRVYLVASAALPLQSPWLEKLRSFDNVAILEGYTVSSVGGSPYLESMTVAAPDGTQQEIPIRGLFVELGVTPEAELVRNLVDLDALGRIKVNSRGETSRPGVYAAGDVTNSYAEQVLIAIGDGAKAVLSAYEHLLRWQQPAPAQLVTRNP
jgi:thioredoxin reductase